MLKPLAADIFGFVLRTWFFAILLSLPTFFGLLGIVGALVGDDSGYLIVFALAFVGCSLPVLVLACFGLWLLLRLPLHPNLVFVLWLLLLVVSIELILIHFNIGFLQQEMFAVGMLIQGPCCMIAALRFPAYKRLFSPSPEP